MRIKICILFSIKLLLSANLFSQQVADTLFNPSIPKPEYESGKGPLVFIDEGHNNFHTAGGRYLPFARLLRADGYVVKGYKGEFNESHLKYARIMVIANALNKINIENWDLPTPSAFTLTEIQVIRKWVKSGGSLFLIADHMPMGGAASCLAAVFNFSFTNGFAADTSSRGPDYFYRKDSTLLSCSITDGRNDREKVNKVVTFTGQAFRVPPGATTILRFDKRYLLMETDTAWVFNSRTRYTPIKDWSQGAYMNYGKGRVVIFGEAAMFTAQLAGPAKTKVGMNSDYAKENFQLLLNIIHWLDRKFK
ncbi:MAG: hypothetical protein Q8868_13070 [Bacteroidota bacterium]|nr:hypothetical protein [Bacteroidota bacterium]